MTVTLQDNVTEKCNTCVLLTSPPWVRSQRLRDSSEVSTLVKGKTASQENKSTKTVKNRHITNTTENTSTHPAPQTTNSSQPSLLFAPGKTMQSKVRSGGGVGLVTPSMAMGASQKGRPGLTWSWVAWLTLLTLCCAQGLSQATTEGKYTLFIYSLLWVDSVVDHF
ncbi:hypothetical protein Pmani_038220 [Petrolisthes manimaculis]|uniref:Uncharacterized protein n=1 Tax=Petrolisthes manimaculis TaxID=1843537 RepID=A0AAE1TKR2_9EUCA|nr:hypothetical protein Pmani_038220 [Petrolisthes manimaculis]